MAAKTLPRHLRELLLEFPQAGVRRSRSGHWIISTPHGRVVEAATPSDRRGPSNTRARLRRAFKT